MSIGLLFWIVYVVWVIFAFYRTAPQTTPWPALGQGVVTAVLFFLLGWRIFGFIVH